MKTVVTIVLLFTVWTSSIYAIPSEVGSSPNNTSNMVRDREQIPSLQQTIDQIEKDIKSETKQVTEIRKTISRASIKIEQYKASVKAQIRIEASCKNQRTIYERQGNYNNPLAQQRLQECYSRVWLSQEKLKQMSTIANKLYIQISNLRNESNVLIPDIERLRIQLEGFKQMLIFDQ